MSGRSGARPPKTSGAPKQKPKVRFTPSPRVTKLETGALEALAQYVRNDITDGIVPASAFGNELKADGTLNDRHAITIYWEIPQAKGNRGAIASLTGFDLNIQNESAVPMDLLVQYPYGYEQAPEKVAGWVYVMQMRCGPGQSMTHRLRPTNNNFVVPCQAVKNGKHYIHAASISGCKQPLAAGGYAPADAILKQEVGLRFTITAIYSSLGSQLGTGEYFLSTLSPTDDFMFTVDDPPVDVVQVSDTGASRLDFELIPLQHGDHISHFSPIRAVFRGAADELTGGLDKEWYEIPTVAGITSNDDGQLQYLANGCYLKKLHFEIPNASGSELTAGAIGSYALVWSTDKGLDNDDGTRFWAGGVYLVGWNNSQRPAPTGGLNFLHEMLPSLGGHVELRRPKPITVAVECVSKHNPQLVKGVFRRGGIQEVGAAKDTILKAVSIIVKVIKTASVVAAALGLMNTVELLDEEEEWDLTIGGPQRRH